MKLNDKLTLYKNMISCNQELSFWRFDYNGELLESDCPQASMFLLVLRHHGLIEYIKSVGDHVPVFAANEAGLSWFAVTERPHGEPGEIYVVGPFFLRTYDPKILEKRLRGIFMYTTGTRDWKERLIQELHNLPVLSLLVTEEMALALYYLVTGQKLRSGAIHYQVRQFAEEKKNAKNLHNLKNYRARKILLRAVREGVGNISDLFNRASATSQLVRYTGDNLTDQKIMSIILTALCSQEAIEGGLSVDLSFSLEQKYIRELWNMNDDSSITALVHDVFRVFSDKVRDNRLRRRYSPPVRSCVEYIEQHVEEKLSIEQLADRLGYSKYYLSRRFREEVGTGINEYIRIAKIEQAKILLESTNDTVEHIAEQLQLSSSTYLADTFKEITGMTASQYRNMHLKC